MLNRGFSHEQIKPKESCLHNSAAYRLLSFKTFEGNCSQFCLNKSHNSCTSPSIAVPHINEVYNNFCTL